MKQTKAPKLTPSPRKDNKSNAVVGTETSPSTVFISMALDMSWRLALVVLIPVITGAVLDKHLKSGSWYLAIGFVLALFGSIAVVLQTYKAANMMTEDVKPKAKQ